MKRERLFLSTGALAFLILAGCASNPPAPPPAQAPPPQPVEFSSGLSPDQMNRLCQNAPDTCARVKAGQPLNLDDVKAMARLGFPSDTIITVVRNSRTVYHLTANQIVDLKAAGASDPVIDYLLNSANSIPGAGQPQVPPPGETAYGAQVAPPPAPAETEPPSPGPDYVWVGGDWVWNGGWIWVGGHWVIPPYPHAVWYHGGWRRGWHGYYHDRGHWR